MQTPSQPRKRSDSWRKPNETTDKTPPVDETLVDSRPRGDWQVNKSAAVIELDCPAIKPDREAPLLVLRPSYADARGA